MKRLANDKRDLILSMWVDGFSLTMIAHAVGCSDRTVSNELRRARLTGTQRRPKFRKPYGAPYPEFIQ